MILPAPTGASTVIPKTSEVFRPTMVATGRTATERFRFSGSRIKLSIPVHICSAVYRLACPTVDIHHCDPDVIGAVVQVSARHTDTGFPLNERPHDGLAYTSVPVGSTFFELVDKRMCNI